MDMVWLDTMFPGIDAEEGWEENMKRVVNYDYLLKEYLDWQLKHLTVDNMDPTDWSNVTSDLIHIAAEYTNNSVEAAAALTLETADDHTAAALTSYYTKAESDAQAALTLETAEGYTNTQLQSYYTAAQTDSAISTQAGLTLTAAEGYTDTKLLSYYTSSQVDGAISAQAVLSQQAAEGYTDTQLASYYTASQVDGAISAQAVLSQAAAEGYTNTALGSYYTKTEIGDFTGYQSAVAALQAYADNAVATIDLSAYYSKTDVDGMFTTSEASIKGYADGLISGLSLAAVSSGGTSSLVLQSGGSTIAGSGASMALSVTNNSNGYSTLALTAGGVTLATSGNITLGGAVMFTGDNISRLNNNSGYQTSSGVTTIIGDTVTTSYINALNVTAKTVKASASISSPYISGGTIVGTNIYSADEDSFFGINSNGWYLQQKTGSTWYTRAYLDTSANSATFSLGNTTPAVLEKYYSNYTHYLWLGDSSRTHGLLINLSTGAYSFS